MPDTAIRLLLVDDDEEEFLLTGKMFSVGQSSHITLDWVATYESALATIQERRHDAYLIDHNLGAHNGLELIQDAQARGCRAPLILLTGQIDLHLDLQAMRAGAADFLDKKSLTGPLLERSVRYAIEHNRILEQLRETNQALQSLVDSSPLAICLIDGDGRVSLWNPAAESIFGWPADEVIGRLLPVVPPEDLTRFRSLVARVMRGDRLGEIALKRRKKDGTLIDVNLWASPLHDAEGRVNQILGMYTDMTAYRRTEEALRTSEEYHRALLANSHDIICVVDATAAMQYISPSLTTILGFTRDDLIGQCAFDFVHPDDRAVAQATLRQALVDDGATVPFTLRTKRKDGTYRVLEGTGRCLDQEASVRGIIVNAHDITDRHHAEQLRLVTSRLSQSPASGESLAEWLRMAQEQIAQIMKADNFYVALYDAIREMYWFPYVSDEHEKFSVYTREEFRKTLTDYIRRTGRPLRVTQKEVDDLVARGEIDEVGTPSPVWIGVPLSTPRGVVGVAAMQDYKNADTYGPGELEEFAALGERIALVIERQQTEEAQQRLSTAIEQAVDLVVITDNEGNIEYVNPAFERTTGYDAASVLGKNPRTIKSGQHDDLFYQGLWTTIRSGSVWSGNFVNRRRDGTLFTEVATITPVRDSSGRIVNYVKVSHDVTAQQMMEAQMRQSQKLEAIGSLAAGIAHEINTPIQFIGNNAHFLSHSFATLLDLITDCLRTIERVLGDGVSHPDLVELLKKRDLADVPYLSKEIPNAISQSLDGIARVTEIVRTMREFSHPGSGTRSRVDINRALEGALTVARSELKNVAEIITDFQSSLPAVECLPNDINQVFLNLLVNAAHAVAEAKSAGRARGVIRVATRLIDGWVEVSVADNGVGIPASIRDEIFKPFFTTKPIGRGTGQGLAIARDSIEKRHGGTIRFESTEGAGTTFYVRLPVEPAMSEVTV
jgi:PAS domain S-box-containing protein